MHMENSDAFVTGINRGSQSKGLLIECPLDKVHMYVANTKVKIAQITILSKKYVWIILFRKYIETTDMQKATYVISRINSVANILEYKMSDG